MLTLVDDRKWALKCCEKFWQPPSNVLQSHRHPEAANPAPGEIPMQADGAAWRRLSEACLWAPERGPAEHPADGMPGSGLPAAIH